MSTNFNFFRSFFYLLICFYFVFAIIACSDQTKIGNSDRGVTELNKFEFTNTKSGTKFRIKNSNKTVVVFSSNFGCSPCSVRETTYIDTAKVFNKYSKYFIYSGMNSKEVNFLDTVTDNFKFGEFIPDLQKADELDFLDLIETNGTFIFIAKNGELTKFVPEKTSIEKSIQFYNSVVIP